jgi:two-component system cell cycle sensor histidine kinase/response regulator CckA
MSVSQHVLIVDDDPVFLSAMARVLRRAGYRVTTAEHFEPALTLLEGTDKPNVLVTDIMMPQSINGVALARMARLRHPQIVCIFVSGYRLPELEQMAFGPVLRKPFEPEQLVGAIEAEFARRAGET